jgi:hypothetical protein
MASLRSAYRLFSAWILPTKSARKPEISSFNPIMRLFTSLFPDSSSDSMTAFSFLNFCSFSGYHKARWISSGLPFTETSGRLVESIAFFMPYLPTLMFTRSDFSKKMNSE